LEFFANDTLDDSNFGEGQAFIGFTNVTTDANGNASFNSTFTTVSSGQFISATATDAAGNTSEFSLGIRANAPPASISINDISFNEGNSSKNDQPLTLSLSSAYSLPITVDYATTDGTAKAGTDYDAASGTVTFAPGQTTQVIDVKVNGDT